MNIIRTILIPLLISSLCTGCLKDKSKEPNAELEQVTIVQNETPILPTIMKDNQGLYFTFEGERWSLDIEHETHLGKQVNLIKTTDDFHKLINLKKNDSGIYIQINNLDFSGFEMTTETNYDNAFEGIYIGLGHTIENIKFSSSASNITLGLFPVAKNASIYNLHLKNIEIESMGSETIVGGLVGYGSEIKAIDCSAKGEITVGTQSKAGLIAGSIEGSYIINNDAMGKINGGEDSQLGLIAGQSSATTMGGLVQDSSANGHISGGSNSSIGMLLGSNTFCTVTSCISVGEIEIKGTRGEHGGLIGHNEGNNSYKILMCRSDVNINSKAPRSRIGSLIGFNVSMPIWECEANGDISIFPGNFAEVSTFIGYASGEIMLKQNVSFGKVTSGDRASIGGIVGTVSGNFEKNLRGNTKIEDCHSFGDLSGGKNSKIGGVVGTKRIANLKNCSSSGNITGGSQSEIGGICGIADGPSTYQVGTDKIINCAATGKITSNENSKIGGIVGTNKNNYIHECRWNSGSIFAAEDSLIGSLVGLNSSRPATISHCWSEGEIESKENSSTGVYIGETNAKLQIRNCLSDITLKNNGEISTTVSTCAVGENLVNKQNLFNVSDGKPATKNEDQFDSDLENIAVDIPREQLNNETYLVGMNFQLGLSETNKSLHTFIMDREMPISTLQAFSKLQAMTTVLYFFMNQGVDDNIMWWARMHTMAYLRQDYKLSQEVLNMLDELYVDLGTSDKPNFREALLQEKENLERNPLYKVNWKKILVPHSPVDKVKLPVVNENGYIEIIAVDRDIPDGLPGTHLIRHKSQFNNVLYEGVNIDTGHLNEFLKDISDLLAKLLSANKKVIADCLPHESQPSKVQLARAENLSKDMLTLVEDIDVMFHLAELHRLKEENNEAYLLYSQIMKIAPQNKRAKLNALKVVHKLNKLDEAEQLLEDINDIIEEDIEALIILAKTEFKNEDYEQSVIYGKKALQIDSENKDATLIVCNSLILMGQLVDAENIINKYLSKHPSCKDGVLALGKLAFAKKEYPQAVTHYTKLLLKLKESAPIEIYLRRGQACLRMGDYNQAISDLNRVKDHSEESVFDAEVYLGESYSGLGELDHANRCFKRALEGKGDEPLIHLKLADIYALQENMEQAKKYYDSSLAIEESAMVYVKRGIWFARENLFDNAASDFEKAIMMEPENTEINLMKGYYLFLKSEHNEALSHFEDIGKINEGDNSLLFTLDKVFSLVFLQRYSAALKEINKVIAETANQLEFGITSHKHIYLKLVFVRNIFSLIKQWTEMLANSKEGNNSEELGKFTGKHRELRHSLELLLNSCFHDSIGVIAKMVIDEPKISFTSFISLARYLLDINQPSSHVFKTESSFDQVQFYLNRGIFNKARFANNQQESSHDQAIEDFSEALKITPDDLFTLYHRAEEYYKYKDYEKCLDDCKTMLDIDSKFLGALTLSAVCQKAKKNYEESKRFFDAALLLKPSSLHIRIGLALLAETEGDTQASIDHFSKFIECNPLCSFLGSGSYTARGYNWHKLKEYDKAIMDYEMSAYLFPRNALTCHLHLSELKIVKEDYRGAYNNASKAVETSPRNALAYFRRGLAGFYLLGLDKNPFAMSTLDVPPYDDFTKAVELGFQPSRQLSQSTLNLINPYITHTSSQNLLNAFTNF